MAEKAGVHAKSQEPKQKCSNFCIRRLSNDPSGSSADRLLQLQRTAGNQAVQRMIESGVLQAKLKVGQPNDIYGQNSSKTSTTGSTTCESCKQKRTLQRASVNLAPESVPSIVNNALNSPWQPLDSGTREYMESSFSHNLFSISIHNLGYHPTGSGLQVGPAGDRYEQEANKVSENIIEENISESSSEPENKYDFSNVQIHTGSNAVQSTRAVGAQAYTVGRDIVFGQGKYRPETTEGRKLIAHELTHVVQQSMGISPPDLRRLTKEEKQENLKSSKFAGNPKLEMAFDNDPPIKIGHGGEAVRLIQETLVAEGFDMPASTKLDGEMDGVFGAETLEVIKQFQAIYELDVDGIVGRQTMGKLDELAIIGPQPPCPIGIQLFASPDNPSVPHRRKRVCQVKPPKRPKSPPKCPSQTPPDKVIINHTVSTNVIEKPGDKVVFNASFSCPVVGEVISKIVGDDGSVFGREISKSGLNSLIRIWNGKKPFLNIGTFLADDGKYHLNIEPIKYAIKSKKDLFTEGPNHDSPKVDVKARNFKGPGQHHFHFNAANVSLLGRIIKSEIGIGSIREQEAIAWCVRNQMIRINKSDVAAARDAFQDAYDKPADPQSKQIAEDVLKKPMADDITSGAIKWFSPRSMPKEGESCKGVDCRGGLEEFTDEQNQKRKVFTPGWSKTMPNVKIDQVRDWFLRIHKL